ncbi:AAA family ATPase [Rhizobium leguminosarum]|uniref:AAA family ATPase n=1 Tax=Rhizobium leguminosarum TaxID=384 RepID=UPI001030C8B1|nr:AAA family ATPase [Rhizobium leguminosarum]TAY82970.1 ATPase [Rhizobium leguminosarum]
MVSLDESFKRAKAIAADIHSNLKNIHSEEDAKIQIVQRVLVECLGWKHTDIGAERKHESGFSDFILSDAGRRAFLIEAKRLGALDIQVTDKSQSRSLRINGPGLSKSIGGIDQAAGYAMPNGIVIAVLTDGAAWVVFKTFIPEENFKDKEAIVFPSFEAVLQDYSKFYELLSKPEFSKRTFARIFDTVHNNRIFLAQQLSAPVKVDELKIVAKSELAFDLDKIFDSFFSRLKGEDDPDLLVECFVETRESRIADFSLEKITANVLGNISPADKEIDAALELLIRDAVDIDEGQSVFIVGPTGAGKTTFLDRFFRKTLPEILKERCVVVKLNCLDASGREDTLLSWMTEGLISSLETQLYVSTDGVPTWNDLLGLYHTEYRRRSTGTDAKLYARDKQAFQEEFGRHMNQQVEKDREGYLRRLLADVVHSRKKLPILVIDNTDEFSLDYKRSIFQFAQALRRHAKHCIVIFPVTDKSAWSFSKTDIFGIYQTKSFFLPTPPPREVFRKRIDYLRTKLEVDNKGRGRSYFSERGIKISVENLARFCSILEDVFVNHEYTSKTLGELSNYNIRRTLTLSRRVITSSVFKISDLLTSYATGEQIASNFTKFLSALMRGDYELYKQGDGHEIYPIFQADKDIRQSPLMLLRILSLLDVVANNGKTVDEKHLSIQSIYDYFEPTGCTEASVNSGIQVLLDNNLIEAFDPSVRDLSPGQKVSISFAGKAHLTLALYNPVFFTQMAFTTAITDPDIARQLRSIYFSNEPFPAKSVKARTIFAQFLISDDHSNLQIPAAGAQYDRQREIEQNIMKLGGDERTAVRGETSPDPNARPQDLTGVLAKVDWFDTARGFGFVDVEGVEVQVYLNAETVRAGHIDRINDGDDILCDVTYGARGPQVSIIHDVQTQLADVSVTECEVVRIFPDRSYGFVRILNTYDDAFFHFSAVPPEFTGKLHEGSKLTAEIKGETSGRGLQVRRFLPAT